MSETGYLVWKWKEKKKKNHISQDHNICVPKALFAVDDDITQEMLLKKQDALKISEVDYCGYILDGACFIKKGGGGRVGLTIWVQFSQKEYLQHHNNL